MKLNRRSLFGTLAIPFLGFLPKKVNASEGSTEELDYFRGKLHRGLGGLDTRPVYSNGPDLMEVSEFIRRRGGRFLNNLSLEKQLASMNVHERSGAWLVFYLEPHATPEQWTNLKEGIPTQFDMVLTSVPVIRRKIWTGPGPSEPDKYVWRVLADPKKLPDVPHTLVDFSNKAAIAGFNANPFHLEG